MVDLQGVQITTDLRVLNVLSRQTHIAAIVLEAVWVKRLAWCMSSNIASALMQMRAIDADLSMQSMEPEQRRHHHITAHRSAMICDLPACLIMKASRTTNNIDNQHIMPG